MEKCSVWPMMRNILKTILRQIFSPSRFSEVKKFEDVRAIWQRHLSPHWPPALIRLIWPARWVSPSSFTASGASLLKLYTWSKRIALPDRRGVFIGQGYTSSSAPLLECVNKLSRSFVGERRVGLQASKSPDTCKWGTACGGLPFLIYVYINIVW